MTEQTCQAAMSAYHQTLVDRDLESLRAFVDDEAIYLLSLIHI